MARLEGLLVTRLEGLLVTRLEGPLVTTEPPSVTIVTPPLMVAWVRSGFARLTGWVEVTNLPSSPVLTTTTHVVTVPWVVTAVVYFVHAVQPGRVVEWLAVTLPAPVGQVDVVTTTEPTLSVVDLTIPDPVTVLPRESVVVQVVGRPEIVDVVNEPSELVVTDTMPVPVTTPPVESVVVQVVGCTVHPVQNAEVEVTNRPLESVTTDTIPDPVATPPVVSVVVQVVVYSVVDKVVSPLDLLASDSIPDPVRTGLSEFVVVVCSPEASGMVEVETTTDP